MSSVFPDVLDLICSEVVVPVVGAGFSCNASDRYPDFRTLASCLDQILTKNRPDLRPLSSDQPLAIADRFAAERGLDALHATICDHCLPRMDSPGDCHKLFTLLPWPMVLTTNYDLLIESANPRDYVGVADDRKYFICRRGRSRMVIKLCGDRHHQTLMRATTERLKVTSLEKECPALLRELISTLKGPLLYIGYSLSDEFFKFAREYVDWLAAKGEGPEAAHGYVVTFDEPSQEMRARCAKNGLEPLALELTGEGTARERKKAAMERFLRELVSGFHERISARKAELDDVMSSRGKAPAGEVVALSATGDVPVLVTPDQSADAIYTELVEPSLDALGLSCIRLEMRHRVDLTTEQAQKTAAMLLRSGCGLWIYGSMSGALDRMVSTARRSGVRAIILATHDSIMGSGTQALRSRIVAGVGLRAEDAQWLIQQLLLAKAHDRMSRAEDALWDQQFAEAVRIVGTILEDIVGVVSVGVQDGSPKRKARGSFRQQVDAIYAAVRAHSTTMKWPPKEAILNLWDLRNAVAHTDHRPSEDEATAALRLTNALLFLATGLLGYAIFPGTTDPSQQSVPQDA